MTVPQTEASCPDCGHDVDHTTACPDGCPMCTKRRIQHVGHLLGVLPDGLLVCDTCEVAIDREAQGIPLIPDPDRIDNAMQYAIAFMNDPEGLAGSREEWRDQLREALHHLRNTRGGTPLIPDHQALLRQVGEALVAVHTASNEDDTPFVDLMAPDLFGLVTEAVAAYSSRDTATRPASEGIPLIDVGLLTEAMKRARPFVDFGSPEQYGPRTAAEYTRLVSESSPAEEGAE